VPNHYCRELYQKLQGLSYDTKSIHDYHKEIKVVMIRAKIVEEREATMTRFLNGLNCETVHIRGLQH